MGWLWESERERPRRSGLKLIALGGLAPLAVAAGVFLVGGKGADHAAAPAAVAQLDCTSPRNAWRAACRSATAEAPMQAVSEIAEEAPKATGAIPPKEAAEAAPARTARASSKPAKPDIAAPKAAQKPVEEASRAQPEEGTPPVRTTALDNPPKAEPAAPPSSEPRIVQKASAPLQAMPERIERAPRREPAAAERAPQEPAKLVRHRVRRITAASAESSRPAPQAMKPAPEMKPARPRVHDTGEDLARFRQPGTETVALPDGRRVFVARSPREAFAGGRDAYRASQWKVTTYRDPIDW